jgi:hypothetical protein
MVMVVVVVVAVVMMVVMTPVVVMAPVMLMAVRHRWCRSPVAWWVEDACGRMQARE